MLLKAKFLSLICLQDDRVAVPESPIFLKMEIDGLLCKFELSELVCLGFQFKLVHLVRQSIKLAYESTLLVQYALSYLGVFMNICWLLSYL